MRTFVALNLPGAEQERLHDALEPLRQRPLALRWLHADTLHITVKFLGDTAGAGIAGIEAVLRDAASRRFPITLRIGRLGAFPSLRRASIVWVGVAADDDLAGLQRELEPALSRLGYPREHQPFRPHITVARARGSGRPPDVERYIGLVDHASTVTVDTIDLMRSRPGRDGSRYEVLVRCPLGVEAV